MRASIPSRLTRRRNPLTSWRFGTHTHLVCLPSAAAVTMRSTNRFKEPSMGCARYMMWATLAAAAAGCGSPPSPSPAIAVTVTANPPQVTGAPCAGCGAGSTDREAETTLLIRETGGASGTVTQIEMSLREQGTDAILASGTFDAAAVTQLAGTNRIPARGTLSVRCGVHYPAEQSGKTAILTYTVRVTGERGTAASSIVTVAVTT
jgi:hypothetical protein